MIEWLLPLAGLYLLHRAGVIELDYPIRQAVRWRRGAPTLAGEPKEGLFEGAARPIANRLIAEYGLEEWRRVSSRTDLATSLVYLEMLERVFTETGHVLPDPVVALDAGPSDWFYVRALHAFLARWGGPRAVRLDGVELDPYRLYDDLRSRHDWAAAYMGGLAGVRYLAMDVRAYREPVDVAFMFYPFIFEADHRRWGLPRRHLRPGEHLAHVAGLVKPGGLLMIVNQGPAERDEQHRLLAEAGLPIAWWAEHPSALWTYPEPRFVTAVRPGRR